jgi:hypothetical protein
MLNANFLTSVKANARIYNNIDDEYLLELIGTAIELIESHIGFAINYREINERVELIYNEVVLKWRPNNGHVLINGIEHIVDYGRTVTTNATRLSYQPLQVSISYQCGFLKYEHIPFKIKQAVRQIVLNIYEHRGDGVNRQDVGNKRTDVNNSILDNSRVKDLLREYSFV